MKLAGRRCVVVGAGKIGEPKIQSLLTAEAEVTVIAPDATPVVEAWAHSQTISWHRRAFEAADLDGATLVIAATPSPEVNESVFLEAQRRGILCNSVDDPEHCDFFYPAVVRRGDLQIAISTAGHSPALAQRLRSELEEQFGPEYAEWVDALGEERQRLFSLDIDPEERRRKLHKLAGSEPFKSPEVVLEGAGS